LLFNAPSTRTYMSFAYAAHHMGMRVEGNESVQFSSLSKGESEHDTFLTIAGYGPSVIVLRSQNVGDAARAAVISPCPVINAGDGSGEYPTQAVLDLYTLQKELGRLTEDAQRHGRPHGAHRVRPRPPRLTSLRLTCPYDRPHGPATPGSVGPTTFRVLIQ
jgi:ornithine carbamoyltransferase